MSQPKEPKPVKLMASVFSPERELLERAIAKLAGSYGPQEWTSPELLFDRTRYYAREMGWPLYRRFITFEPLIHPGDLVQVKLRTNEVEQEFLHKGCRRVNIDPGYVSPERLILATGKNYVHRVYLSNGIYADLTLIYYKGSFKPLKWTYKDYADPEIIDIFNRVRQQYMNQLRRMKRLD